MDAGLSYFRISNNGNERISLLPIYGDALFDIPVQGQIIPYLSLGFGLYSGEHKISQWTTYTDRNFGMRMAGGIHFDAARYFTLRIKVSYTLLELFTSNTLCDHLSLEIEGMYKIQ